MYARYIPPSRGPAASGKSMAAAASPTPAQARAPAAAPAKAPADGFSYARYIPGAKAHEGHGVLQYFDDEAGSPKPKPKRKRETADEALESRNPSSKKSKTRGEQNGVKQVAAQGDGEKARMPDADAKKMEKKNRRKRKQRTRADDDDSQDSENEAKSPSVEAPEPRIAVAAANSLQVDAPEPQIAGEEKSKPEKKKKKHKEKPKHGRPDTKDVKGIRDSQDGDIIMADANKPRDDTEPAVALESEGIRERKKKKKDKEGKKAAAKVQASGDALKHEQEQDLRHKAVLERKAKSLELASATARDAVLESEEQSAELHGLEPLPQPAVVADDESKPTYDTLPAWLAKPIRVSQDTRAPFKDLGILPRPARILEQKGFSEAFAVQTAAIPLLLPTSKHLPGDVLISAATGSGKTLAYALPMVRDVSQVLVTRLRALVVLPTRELVKQAQEVFEICARAYDSDERKKVRIGVAVGSQSIKTEQQVLVESESRYDPEAYKEIEEQDRRRAQKATSMSLDDMLDPGADEKDARLGRWQGEVVDFSAKVDILICTPGRLVEHIEQTPGFCLDYVRWLVVDEADKMLAQSFQGWLDLVTEQFQVQRLSARDFADMAYSGVRKVILSATLTRDLSLLNQLSLRRPQLIMLEDEGAGQISDYGLPASLQEYAVRVHDTNLKPLYLLDLLRGQHLGPGDKATLSKASGGSDTSSDSASSSDTSSHADGSSSDEDAPSVSAQSPPQLPHCLVFTKSNESALRLSRLLTLLDESLAGHMSTLTSTTPTHIRRKMLRAFATRSSAVRVMIASDLVARGVDVPKLEHVINYDLPPSVAGYVHRVGRTARAGRAGCAWTLVGDDESGWFWRMIGKGQGVRRAHKVERCRIEPMGEERVRGYEEALATLGKEALEVRRR